MGKIFKTLKTVVHYMIQLKLIRLWHQIIMASATKLKLCSEQLAPVFHHLFEWSLNCCVFPIIWKTSTITPVPKISKPCILNDYPPVALALKCFDRIIRDILIEETKPFTDPFQFAYCAKREVLRILLLQCYIRFMNIACADKPRSYVRTLFIDFSSVFNTMQPHALMCKLQNMNTNLYESLCLRGYT